MTTSLCSRMHRKTEYLHACEPKPQRGLVWKFGELHVAFRCGRVVVKRAGAHFDVDDGGMPICMGEIGQTQVV
jgi:hypothetical protein